MRIGLKRAWRYDGTGQGNRLNEGGFMSDAEWVRETVRAFMGREGMDAAQLARRLHPAMTAEDVKRFLAGEPAVCEEERELTVSSIMGMFADSLDDE
jgi:hypothetical protein